MGATVCLISGVLALAQVPPGTPTPLSPPQDAAPLPAARGGDYQLAPRLRRALELVYRGTLSEEVSGSGVQYSHAYRLENRVFVLDTNVRGSQVAFLTVLNQRDDRRSVRAEDAVASSARIELATVDAQGHVTGDGADLAVPLDGPPTVECGAFVEAPPGRVTLDQMWQVRQEGRPALRWRVVGHDTVNGTRCLKLEGVQQSDDWQQPRGDRTAWRRQDTVWIAPQHGVAYKVERTVERRAPGRFEPTQRTVLRYELESSLPYPRQLFEDRRTEIERYRDFLATATPLQRQPGKHEAALETLLGQINHHLEHHPKTPYREAVLYLRRRVEAARRGEAPPERTPATLTTGTVKVAALGQPAPDFVATDLVSRESIRLQRWQGKPVLLLFYHPASVTAEELLRFGQEMRAAHQDRIAVLGLAMGGGEEQLRKLRDGLKLTFPLVDGVALRQSYAVEATPKVVLVDADGRVRINHLGWGAETAEAVEQQIKRGLR